MLIVLIFSAFGFVLGFSFSADRIIMVFLFFSNTIEMQNTMYSDSLGGKSKGTEAEEVG